MEWHPGNPPPAHFRPTRASGARLVRACVTQINEKLWEGRYSPIWPDGKKHPRNIYAHSEEECKRLLTEMITETKAEIAAEKERLKAEAKAG